MEQLKFLGYYFQIIIVGNEEQSYRTALRLNATGVISNSIENNILEYCLERVKHLNQLYGEKRNNEWHVITSQLTKNRVVIPDDNGYRLISIDDVVYLKAEGTYLHVVTKDNRYFVTRRLKDYEYLMASQLFFKPHRSYMINVAHISQYLHDCGGHIVMSNGDHITVSREKKKDFLSSLNHVSNRNSA